MAKSFAFAALLFACACSFAQTPSASGDSTPALPHDTHEGMTVSVDPYRDAARSKQKFGKADPLPTGILPVEVFIRNDSDQPLRIDLSSIQMEVHPEGSERQDIDNLSASEVAAIMAHPGGPATPHTRRIPIGIPTGGNDKKVDKLVEVLHPLELDADVVPPSGQIHGFLFFNVNHQLSVVEDASLYMPDVTIIPSKTPLIFFEVPMVSKPKE